MIAPKRIRLKRGQPMPPNTVNVDAPSKWANTYDVVFVEDDVNAFVIIDSFTGTWSQYDTYELYESDARKNMVARFRYCLFALGYYTCRNNKGEVTVDDIRHELRGKNLATWEPLDMPSHADVLLEIANSEEGSGE